MTDTRIITRYTVVTALTMAALILLGVALSLLAGFTPGAGTGILTVILPALDAGANVVRKTGQIMEKDRMWRLAPIFTLINFGLGLLVLLVLSALMGVDIGAIMAQLGFGTMMLILVGVMILYLLVARFFIGLGARSEMKRRQKTRR